MLLGVHSFSAQFAGILSYLFSCFISEDYGIIGQWGDSNEILKMDGQIDWDPPKNGDPLVDP